MLTSIRFRFSTPTPARLFAGAALTLLMGAAAPAAQPPPWHYVARLGFADERHTAADGFQASEAIALSESNHTIGISQLFVGLDDVPPETGRRAQTAWVANGDGVTRRTGLYDLTHTRDDGRQEAYPFAVNDHGVSIGASARFSEHNYAGESAWVATASGSTLRVGFYDAAHTASFGATVSVPVALSGANKLIGFSENPENGHRTGWIANSIGQYTAIGLTDVDHTTADGRHATFPVALNDEGYVVGNSDFYAVDSVLPGSTAWLRRPDRSMRLIGFQSGVHAAPNGQHASRVELLTESGFIAGWSTRYGTLSNDGIGQTAWVTHVDGPNRPAGFYTGIHLGQNGVVHSQVQDLNENGNAIGISIQYSGPNPNEFDVAGTTAWITTPAAATVRVGLYDAEHSIDGRQFNEVVALNETGSLVGLAARYRPNGDFFGTDAFVANAAGQTGRLGLTDAMHTRDDGYRASFAGALTNATNFVAGFSERYNGGAELVGRTAWIYTRGVRSYVRFELSVRASDGFAESIITRLLEDGRAAGHFRLFGSDGADLGERAFVYLPGEGAFMVESNLDADITEQGWAHLADAALANANGYLAGAGARDDGTTYGAGVYLVNEATVAPAKFPLIRLKLMIQLR